ncbi:hypothetical protein RFI_14312 [Reticulomyxa filosa]|uniref:Transmembrane protein n=1 Tax=Reticulomyxa filosa TaxID=46433 RepID=X6NC58_RETFI|nr:hypothetical protein RFI_14312 [Reticulomyxa filosa]|eukprot:ETO22882.1 hypothetical protein RFI_14312 [Reticulomyxa filosa]
MPSESKEAQTRKGGEEILKKKKKKLIVLSPLFCDCPFFFICCMLLLFVRLVDVLCFIFISLSSKQLYICFCLIFGLLICFSKCTRTFLSLFICVSCFFFEFLILVYSKIKLVIFLNEPPFSLPFFFFFTNLDKSAIIPKQQQININIKIKQNKHTQKNPQQRRVLLSIGTNKINYTQLTKKKNSKTIFSNNTTTNKTKVVIHKKIFYLNNKKKNPSD